MNCPYLEVKDTGWFSWECYCRAQHEKLEDENSHSPTVENVCHKSDNWPNCPYYQRKNR